MLADTKLTTLSQTRQRIHVRGENGKNGVGKGKDGSNGEDMFIPVPVGTIIREGAGHDGRVAGELSYHGQTMCVSRGGRGGRGNQAFKTATNKAPKLMLVRVRV